MCYAQHRNIQPTTIGRCESIAGHLAHNHLGSDYQTRLKEPLLVPAGRERVAIEHRPAAARGVLLIRLSVA